MQCQSYLPLYYTHNDLNVDANGNTRPVYTGHAKPPTGHFSQRLLGYDKEFMRQTILQQEITFKGQVQELHRLYRRQRELLDEINRPNSYKKNVLSEVQWLPNSLASNVSFSSDQKAAPMFASGANISTAPHVSINVRSSNVLDLSLSQNNIARRKPLNLQLPADEFINSEGKEFLNNFEVSRVSILSTHASNRACPITPLGNTKPFFVSTSPATVSSQMIDLAKFSGSKHTWSGTLNDFPDKKKLKMCKDLIETDYTNASQRWQPCGENEPAGKSKSSLNSSSWYSYSESLQRLAEAGQVHQTAPLFTNKVGRLGNERRYTDGKILGSIHEMLDVNTPGQVGASHIPILEFPAAHHAIPYLSPKFSAIKCQAPRVDVLDYSSRSRDIHEKARSLQVKCSESNVKTSSASSCFLFQSYQCDLASADNVTAKHTNRLDSIDLSCTGIKVLDGISADSINDSREKVDDLTSPELVSSQVFPSSSVAPKEHIPNADQEQTGQNKKHRLFDINLPCHITTDMERLEDDPVGIDSKHSNLINLNSNVKDDQISSSSASSRKVTEVDLEASIIPISPEKKECPRPRGESQENKTETSLSTGEDGESMDELVKIAVDVLVSISSSEAQQNSTESEQCLASSNEMLSWFAGVVCLMEKEDVEKCEKFSSSTGIDEFEAMTLKLTETSVENYWSNTTTLYNEKETCDVQFSGESSKGRTTKRVKRKNFQREVLPSLASLSRYEASEDIQIIESLMEAAGAPLQMGVKTRKLGRKRRLRGRKKTHVNDGTATPLESRICLLALPQTGIPAIDLKEKGRLRWENMPRQPRGKRCRAVFPSINLSQEGWMKKWGGIGFAQKRKKKIKQVEMLVPQVASS